MDTIERWWIFQPVMLVFRGVFVQVGNCNHPKLGFLLFLIVDLTSTGKFPPIFFCQKKTKELVQHYEKDVAFIRDSSKASLSREIEVGVI